MIADMSAVDLRMVRSNMAEKIREKESKDISSILKSNLFSNLLPTEKQFITDRTGLLQLRKGGLLFSPGKEAEHLYVLVEGLVRVYKSFDDGGEEEIARFTPGDNIGDFDFARSAEYDAYAEAIEDSVLALFPSIGFTLDSFISEAPHIISKIHLNSVAMVTDRIKDTRKLIIESMSWVQELQRKIHEDPGTGLWKQSFITEELNQLLEDPMALIMLKPDRFKVLVDAAGHDAGDKAMIKIAALLKNIIRRLGRGWALRFKSNETGILINKCDATLAEALAHTLATAIADLPPVSLGKERGDFSFSGSIAWGIWPTDDRTWDSFFEGTYTLLRETWKAGGKQVVRYKKEQSA